MKHTALEKFSGKSNGSSASKRRYPYFAICIEDRGDDISLKAGKIYRVIRPDRFDGPHDVRVIDETGEDYLYSASQFVAIDLPAKAKRALVAMS